MGNVECGTIYGWNQQEMNLQTPLDTQTVTKTLVNVGAWFSSNMKVHYYMLLNREFNDYTIFNFLSQNFYKGVQELQETLENRGLILAVEYNHTNDYYEIWLKSNQDGLSHMYLLFPCDDFIIEI